MEKQKLPTVNTLTDVEGLKQKANSSIVSTIVSHESASIKSSYTRIIQNFLLIWLDADIDGIKHTEYRDIITQFRQITNNVKLFDDVDQCIDFLTDISEEKAFIILSGTLAPTVISIAQDISQINSIYIFCDEVSEHKQCSKVKGVFTQVSSVCEALKQDARFYDRNAVSISLISTTNEVSKQNLNQLDQSFMYSQILKEILLTIDFNQQHISELTAYYREHFDSANIALNNIDQLEREYHSHMPIWWYTHSCFLYSMLNRALRTMEVDIIIKIGFFLRDLHQNITELHTEQYPSSTYSASFTVYRGQGMSQTDFHQLMKTKDGLMSFNNFLSTSCDREVSLAFAESNQNHSDLIGVLFEITIDPSSSSTPFANIRNFSCYQEEDEILFSMHSVFRIGQIKQIDSDDHRLWQVELTLTKDNDSQLHTLSEYIREETHPETKGWYRLVALLVTLGKFDKAQQVCDVLFEQTSDEYEKAHVYYLLGQINYWQGEYAKAITFHEKALENKQTIFSPNHFTFAVSYSNIAVAYSKMGEYMKALSFHEKALEIGKQVHPSNDRLLATCYDNIGLVCIKMGEYTKALSFSKKALEIYKTTLPSNHPDLGLCYTNMATIYEKMNEYTKSLSFHEQAFKISEKLFPPDHPGLALAYDNLGVLYAKLGRYLQALSHYEKALKIFQKALPLNHPDLAICYDNISKTYDSMGDYSKALFYREILFEIREKILPPNHPTLAADCNYIGVLYGKMDEFLKTLSFFQRAVDIGQQSLRLNDPDLQKYLQNLEAVKQSLNNF